MYDVYVTIMSPNLLYYVGYLVDIKPEIGEIMTFWPSDLDIEVKGQIWGHHFDQDGPRYTELTVMYHYWALFALKCHYLAYFAVIWIQILICDLNRILICIYLIYRKTPVSGCKLPWFGLFWCKSGSTSKFLMQMQILIRMDPDIPNVL